MGSDAKRANEIHVVIIGGGGTGAAVLHDLVQRGYRCTLFERGELTSGTTGRHHGQLHSGARYAVGDVNIARECMHEVEILRRIAPESIEMNYGLFLALTEEDVTFAKDFQSACSEAGITNRRISIEQALKHEPRINPDAHFAVVVPDGTLDAYRLPMQFFATAVAGGGVVRSFCQVTGLHRESGRINGVEVYDYTKQKSERVDADIVVNATGPWAGMVAELADIELAITPAPGTMVSVKGRHCNMVVSHLHPAGDGDIIVPQRNLSTIGSTQWEVGDPDGIQPPDNDVEWLLERANDLMPGFSDETFHAAWTAARPLAGIGDVEGRELSRDFAVRHHDQEGGEGMFTVLGGKATVLRAMGEGVADAVCAYTGIDVRCKTEDTPLLSHRDYFRRSAS
ncbi:MAG: FAD-dependent oxidoreductase [Spirochaetota bacterium]